MLVLDDLGFQNFSARNHLRFEIYFIKQFICANFVSSLLVFWVSCSNLQNLLDIFKHSQNSFCLIYRGLAVHSFLSSFHTASTRDLLNSRYHHAVERPPHRRGAVRTSAKPFSAFPIEFSLRTPKQASKWNQIEQHCKMKLWMELSD